MNDKFNGVNNNEDRLKQLEDNVEILKESQDAQDYQIQTLNDKTSDLKEQKVDNTTFDLEINTLKDLLNQLLNKGGDIPKVDLSQSNNALKSQFESLLDRLKELENRVLMNEGDITTHTG